MAGKIKKIIDSIIQERSKGNPAIAEMTKAKFILKGINPDNFNISSADDPLVIEKLHNIEKQLNVKQPEDVGSNIKSVYSSKTSEKEAVFEIKNQLKCFGVKLLVFFASSNFNHDRLSYLMQEAFRDSAVVGCSTAGEIYNGVFLKNSVVAMAFNSNIVSDAKVEVIEQVSHNLSVEAAFRSFEIYYNESSYSMLATRYVGIVLVDGLCRKEEEVIDRIGNRTNVYFIGGSAGDDQKYQKTFVCANGKAYTDSAVLCLLKMNDHAEFEIIKTQSFKALDRVLIANKVNEETREVIEFDNQPAISAYANAVGVDSVEEAPNCFMTNPVGLVIGENNILVRTPLQKKGSSIQFACNILEGMEVKLLESTNIIEDTQNILDKKINEFGRIEGIINFHCIMRTLELEKKNLVKQYGELFNDIPNIGFSTYGELYIGHVNQTATMLVFKVAKTKSYNQEVLVPIETHNNFKLIERDNNRLINENSYLRKELIKLNQQLEETTAALKQFNIMLDEEINERTKREKEIRYLSYHDKLTGLYNRRFYEEEIQKLDIEANFPISIIMGDVNRLKVINDTFGHHKGDELIQRVAAAIKNTCRREDIVARWGGDEFVIILLKTNKEEAEAIANRINNVSMNEQINGINCSISLGWDTKSEDYEDIDRVIRNAEDHMYKHKIIRNEGMRSNAISPIINTLHEKNYREELHSKRVSKICQTIGKAIGFSEIEISKLKLVGLLHDIGKIAIEDSILNKPGSLTVNEYDEIKRHPEIGYRILSSSNEMLELADCILVHHERWDGKGYPKGLKGKEIPLLARIIAIADAYDAMTSERSYRRALPKAIAIEELRKNAGSQFDPELTKIFIEKVLDKI